MEGVEIKRFEKGSYYRNERATFEEEGISK